MSIVLMRRPFTVTPRRRPSGRLPTAADNPQSTKARPEPPPAVPLVIEASCRLPVSGRSIHPTSAMSNPRHRNLIDVCCVAEDLFLQACKPGTSASSRTLRACAAAAVFLSVLLTVAVVPPILDVVVRLWRHRSRDGRHPRTQY